MTINQDITKQVLMLYGGESTEHEVSIRSADSIYQALDKSKYDVELGYIDRRGVWWLLDGWQDVASGQPDGEKMVADIGRGSFVVADGDREIKPDVILPVLHGQFGEDGTVQGLAEMMHLPVVGCDARSSVLCWDKVATKQVLEAGGIVTSPHRIYNAGDPTPEYRRLTAELSGVLFVKPARSGSSIGVSRVTSQAELLVAIDTALEHDNKLLIEQAIVGRELEVAVLGNPPDHQVSGVGEIRPGEEFYSYDDKYDDASTAEVIVDADLADQLRQQLQQIAHQAYAVLGCRGLSRIDFLVSDAGDIYVNEVNTFPGFTSISQYPKLWQAAGVGYAELLDRLIDSALEDK